jgi:hypothetical protein
MATEIERMMALFAGLDRAYGLYDESAPGEKKKKGGHTISARVTGKLWANHLAGVRRLGIVPIRDDNSAVFGAVDIDDYTLDHKILAERLAPFPVNITRSKSGGAHVWLFSSEPISAAVLRGWLTQLAVYLGYPGAEVFPKQSTLASKNDVGNWIHVPYFASERTGCYGIDHDGKALALLNWLDWVEGRRVAGERALAEITMEEVDLLQGAPPCLVALARNGIPEGMRNAALFAFGVFVKKAHDPGWEDVLAMINQRYFSPPLEFSEVADTIKSVGKKQYFYPCSKPPIVSVCNKEICRTVEHGIGGSIDDPGIQLESITKIDSLPPYYFVQVNGKRIEVPDSAMLLSQGAFRKLVFEALDMIPMMIKEAKWAQLINGLMQGATHITAPVDAGAYGQFYFHLVQFCVMKGQARDRDELLLGKPWADEDGVVWFRSTDLIAYLDRHRFRAYTSHKIWALLRENLGAEHRFVNINGSGCNIWGVSLPSGDKRKVEDIPDDVYDDVGHDPFEGVDDGFGQ